MAQSAIEAAKIHVATVTAKTKWIFVEMRLLSGEVGWGEATAQGAEDAVVKRFTQVATSLVALSPEQALTQLQLQALSGLADAAAVSALDQAIWDLIGVRQGMPIAQALGAVGGLCIPVYANINRRTSDRSPAGFARSASDAIAAGHEAIKIAPFDEVTNDVRSAGEAVKFVSKGLERMLAVREEIGSGRRLMIDCHWRFDLDSARYVIDAASEAGLYWVECPLPEARETMPDIRKLRDHANRLGVKLAGCEQMIRVDGFRPFLDAGAYDVIMPDVKYAGGLREALSIADRSARNGVEVSPHNPSGPMSHAMSLQLCCALGSETFLELQFDETPLFDRLQSPKLPVTKAGRIKVPLRPGAGTGIARDVLQELSA